MGIFSFLLGGKKGRSGAAPAPPPVDRAMPLDKPLAAAAALAALNAATVPAIASSIAQAKIRLRLSSSLRCGDHAAAYAAASQLADMQTRAGRPTAARVWREQAARIKSTASI